MKLLICVLAFSLLGISCGKECPCEKESVNPIFVSYADSEVDTLIVTRFEKGSNFTRQMSTATWTLVNTRKLNYGVDSVMIMPTDRQDRLDENADWTIFNPVDGKTTSISDISLEIKKGKCGKGLFSMDPQVCISPVVSYRLNGNLLTIPENKLVRGAIIKK